MATLLNLLDDLRDRLNDSGDVVVTKPVKINWINYGIRATWPKLYITARDNTLVYSGNDHDYNIPAAVGNNTKILRVEVEDGLGSANYNPLSDFEIIQGLTDPILSLNGSLNRFSNGVKFRITAAKRISDLATDGDPYLGPSGTEELPVLYAMGIALSRRLEDRMDYKRMAVTQGQNSIHPADLMEASQFWFAQYELLLDRMAMPLPTSDY